MKIKVKVLEHKKYLADDKSIKGHSIIFKTNFGDRISAFVNPDDEDLLYKYDIDTVHVVDLYAYKGSDGVARLGVKLEREAVEENF